MRKLPLFVLAVISNLLLLLLPIKLLGAMPMAADDIAMGGFLFLASLFCGLESINTPAERLPRQLHAADVAARRLALATGLAILALFWSAQIERAVDAKTGAALSIAQLAGAALMLLGTALRLAAMRTLGRAFRTEIRVEPNQQLVQSGVYRSLRHPSETGLLAIALGAGLLLESIAAMPLGLCLLGTVLLRLAWEDRQLAAAFGPQFERYAARVPRLLPSLTRPSGTPYN